MYCLVSQHILLGNMVRKYGSSQSLGWATNICLMVAKCSKPIHCPHYTTRSMHVKNPVKKSVKIVLFSHVTCFSPLFTCISHPHFTSLLSSRFGECQATLPQRNEPHSFPVVFVVCLHSVEQANHIIAKCEWGKTSGKKACGANNEEFLAFIWRRMHITKNGLCSRATIMTNEKNVNESPKYKCFMHSSLCSAMCTRLKST